MDRQVGRANWPAFVDQFSQDNEGKKVSVEALGESLGAETVAENVPLMAIDFDPQGQGELLVTLAEGEETLTRAISAPKTIWERTAPDGSVQALEIIAEDMGKTIIRF